MTAFVQRESGRFFFDHPPPPPPPPPPPVLPPTKDKASRAHNTQNNGNRKAATAPKPPLRWNFKGSVFANGEINFGRRTACIPHQDQANLAFGWCAVTALGHFDHTMGGHLVFWNLKLVVEFPAGATILFPSAVLLHSNVNVRPEETRYSFTQFSAGAFFRFIDNKYMLQEPFEASLSEQERLEYDRENDERFPDGVQMFSIVDDVLVSQH